LHWSFSSDSPRLAFTSWDDDAPVIRVLNLATGETLADLNGTAGPFCLSPDGRRVAFNKTELGLDEAPATQVWDIVGPTLRCSLSLPQHRGLHFTPDGRSLVALVNSASGRLYDACCWDLPTGHERFRVADIVALAWSRDGSILLTEHSDLVGSAFLQWNDGHSRQVLRRIDLDRDESIVATVHLDPVGSSHGEFFVTTRQPAAPPRLLSWIDDHTRGALRRLGWVPDQPMTRLFDTDTGRPRGQLPISLSDCAWSPDGRLVAVTGATGLELWDVPPRKPLATFVALAAVGAAPIVGLTVRRIRRLRHAPVEATSCA
jgi:WD40 repeat protein